MPMQFLYAINNLFVNIHHSQVGALLFTTAFGFTLYALYDPNVVDKYVEILEFANKTGKPVLITVIAVGILSIILNIGLYCGASTKTTCICWTWIVFRTINIICIFVVVITKVEDVKNYIALGSNIIVDCYLIWVVFSFIREVGQQQRQVGVRHSNAGGTGGTTGQLDGAQQPVYYPSDQLQPTFTSIIV
ncbi:unnamed protein product [Orchesella dallaii]|uniref:Transmembrane protein n=1 Tax=Orchesella dallaii TaxID=48710 RepID=A0ABP1QGF4_9HEXA